STSLVDIVTLYFFFFQAEDGIRDFHVTGVQTCALPISMGVNGRREVVERLRDSGEVEVFRSAREPTTGHGYFTLRPATLWMGRRSEERRVGKECRSRRWPDHEKTKV